MDEYKDGQAAASGDEPARVIVMAPEPTEYGLALIERLRELPRAHRLYVRGGLVRVGYRQPARIRPEDGHQVDALVRGLMAQAETAFPTAGAL